MGEGGASVAVGARGRDGWARGLCLSPGYWSIVSVTHCCFPSILNRWILKAFYILQFLFLGYACKVFLFSGKGSYRNEVLDCDH